LKKLKLAIQTIELKIETRIEIWLEEKKQVTIAVVVEDSRNAALCF